MKKEHNELIAAYLADKNVSEELLAACREEPEVLEKLAELQTIDRLLFLHASDEGADVFSSEVSQRIVADKDDEFSSAVHKRLETKKRSRIVWITTFAAAACLLFTFFILRENHQSDLGTVTATRDAIWKNSGKTTGDQITKGILKLNHGYSEITLNNGVTMMLEGPVEIDIKSIDQIRLLQGRLVANVPEGAIGFTVLTPSSEVVDLGTEFGVSVDATGSSEVHVLEGEVKARPLNGKDFTHLITNEAMAFKEKNLPSRMQSQPEKYLRSLPGRSSENPQYLHWSCDQKSDELICDGTGIDGQFFPGKLMSLEGKELPAFTNGQFGEALYFNGKSSYVETEFSGIGGTAPRTVAFWAKVPKDFNTHNGYGMLGWGLTTERGAAWQISPNPNEKEGLLGRLRVGTYEAPVIGTTDLRDDRWHHIAVVMYGGETADSSTHILLYVDGKLESTTAKAVAPIDTKLEHPESRSLMIGRNLGYKKDSQKVRARFFEGWLDEIYIFDTALEQEQIQGLMDSNQWK